MICRVTEDRRATFRAKRFGRRLRDLREAAGLTIDDVMEALRKRYKDTNSRWRRVSRPTLTRLEQGLLEIDAEELTPFLDLYNVTDRREKLQLRQLTEVVRKVGWWEGMVSDQDFADYVWAESFSEAIDSYRISNVPGPLQPAEIAEKLIRHGERGSTEAEIQDYLDVRLTRADMLWKPDAPHYRFLIYEGALRHRNRIFTKPEYSTWYRYMLEIAELPTIELRYLPFDTDCPAFSDVNAGFTILKLREQWPTLVHVETLVGAVVGEDPGIDSSLETFETLWIEGAKDSAQTTEFLEKLALEVEK